MIRGPETGNNPLKCKRAINYMINDLLDVMSYWMPSDWHRVASNWRLKTWIKNNFAVGDQGREWWPLIGHSVTILASDWSMTRLG